MTLEPVHRLFRILGSAFYFFAAWSILGARGIAAESSPGAATPTITSSSEFWTLGPTAGDREFPIRTEIGINYYDPEWHVIWAEWDGAGCYLDAGDKPLPLRSGQTFEITGIARPGRQQIVWASATIKPAGPFAPVPVPLPDPLPAPNEFSLRMVTATGLVSEQVDTDPTHVRLTLAGDHWTITVHVRFDPGQAIPQWLGSYVRLSGVFAAKYDPAQKQPFLEIWVPQPDRVEVQSWLQDDVRFELSRTEIEALPHAPHDRLVRIEGIVRAQDPGQSVTVRDDTGQVQLLTRQTNLVPAGHAIEAIGYPDRSGVNLQLQRSVFRSRTTEATPVASATRATSRLRLTEQVRQLPRTEATRGFPVELSGVVTWIEPSGLGFFMQDSTGGLRVALPPDRSIEPPVFSTDVIVTGVTHPGDVVPIVQAKGWTRGSGVTLPMPTRITFEQAMSGATYAEWVELRGYVRSVTEDSGLTRLDLTTPGGEIVVYVPSLPANRGVVGDLVDLRGVCDVVTNDRRQLAGARLWVPGAEFIQTREPAPTDVFATPGQTIGSLLEIGSASQMHHRVRVSGVVSLHRPGVLFYLEDGDDRLLALSRQSDPLQPGDRVEVVGFPGHEPGRLILRDAVYRRNATGVAPKPALIDDLSSTQLALDGATVRVTGRLLNQMSTAAGIRLQLQHGQTLFEAVWPGSLPQELPITSLLEIVGVYRVQFDEYRQPRAFEVDLRFPEDVRVIQRPSWWTAPRVLWAGGGLLAIALLCAGWAVSVSRKNGLLRAVERELNHVNSDLEARVASRTRDLELEVAERQRSQEALAEERQLLRTLIDSLPVYLYVKDLDGRFVIGNQPHASLLGAQSGLAVVGRTDFDLFPAELAQRYRQDDQRVLGSSESLLQIEEPGQVNGQPRWFSTTKVPLRDLHGQIVGLIGISQDITERKQAEAEREKLNRQLLGTSRQAGMAEVATGILHNVGNVLNSVNVSATLIVERIRSSKVTHVTKLTELLQAHADDLPGFFSSDGRGTKVPEFLASLAKELNAEQARNIEELDHLWKKIEHIKDIVSMQQSYAKVAGAAEIAELSGIIDDSLRINATSLTRHGVEVIRDYHANPVANTERHKVVQILVNLICNAKQACDGLARGKKRLTIRLTEEGDRAQIAVIDNGVGIPPENLTRIFSHGFTTRKDGHGFGLHSGSLTARELGGSLSAHSDGPGCGSTFTLELPLAPHGSAAGKTSS